MPPVLAHLLTLMLALSPLVPGGDPAGAPSGPLRVVVPVRAATSSGATQGLPVAPLGSATGVWPLSPRPRVVARFDPPRFAYGPGHRGVDLAGSRGQAVHAAAAGRVTFAGSVAGRGVVVVSHGAARTTYEPVRASVRVGAVVRAGQQIGTLEDFGSHCWPALCLHWGLIEGDTYLDPLSLVGAGPVRLLPLFGSPGG